MLLYEKLLRGEESLSVIGLGYVGISTAVAFSKKVSVVGFDVDTEKIDKYNRGIDPTFSIGDEQIKRCSVKFTCDESLLKSAKFHIIAVPTPINSKKEPDISLVENACCVLGRNLSAGSVVVVESTVYPGMTEEICIPVLERASGLKCGEDFKVGYSPERVNPGDTVHRFENILKVVSGMDEETLEEVAGAYSLVVEAGVHRAPSIKVAEAAKAVENAQRDINIAFMNEISVIMGKMGIDTKSVLEAAGTKWNFLKFTPGLVGGQCIGVDPYYLMYQSSRYGYESKVIKSGRCVNEFVGKYVAESVVSLISKAGKSPENSRVAVLGVSFKENFPDVRNTKVLDVVEALRESGVEVFVCDPVASFSEVEAVFGNACRHESDISDVDALVFAVAHDEFKNYKLSNIDNFYRDGKKIIADVKGIFNREEFENSGYVYWRL